MPNPSIRARLILLSVLLLAVFAVCCALLIRELARDSRTLVEEARLVSVVKSANSASKHFGDLKFWELEAAVTQLTSSQQKAAAAKAGLTSDLKAVSAVDPALVATIERDVDALTELARKAGVAYSSDDSAAGDALLAQAKEYVPGVDDRIDRIVDQVEQRALARRDAATREAELAVRLSIIGGLVALAAALGFTALTVRSITVPLGRLERSMVSIMHGELDVAVPPMGSHEIGAMAKTLGMLRDSLIDRDRMERERQRAEAEIRAARDTAEMALSELKATQANLLHAEKMASLGELTAGIAHEFRNGLATIHGYSKLFDLQALPEPYRPYVEGIRAEAESLGQVVTNFLNFARPAQLVLSRVDLRSICERAADEFRAEARALGGDVEVLGEFGDLDGDDVLLRQAFSNLLRNAVEACADASVAPVILIQSEIDPAQRVSRIAVNDTGPGIPTELRERVFRPFFTSKRNGTGLGLALVQKIIVFHNGRIVATSFPQGGASLQITLPLRG